MALDPSPINYAPSNDKRAQQTWQQSCEEGLCSVWMGNDGQPGAQEPSFYHHRKLVIEECLSWHQSMALEMQMRLHESNKNVSA